MKKFARSAVAMLLAVQMVLMLAPAAFAASAFDGGAGTKESPYLIRTKAQLDAVRNDLDAHYKLTADLVFSEADFGTSGAFYNDGSGWIPIGSSAAPFTGVFDGDEHSITGLYVNASAESSGLFGDAGGARIKNLSMENVEISASALTGTNSVGAVAGSANAATITSCSVSGSISGVNAGGIVGCAEEAVIMNCSSTADVNGVFVGGIAGLASDARFMGCSNSGEVTGGIYVGGIVGYAYGGTISKCHNAGNVSVGYYVGGIAGDISGGSVADSYNAAAVSGCDVCETVGGIAAEANAADITNCYNAGAITSGSAVGAIAGIGASLTNCYYLDNTLKGLGSGEDAGTKCTATELAQQSTFTAFDFVNVWTMDGDEGYPYPELLTVPLPTELEIVVQPADVTAAEEATVSFTVTAVGDGLSYQWQYSSNSGKTWRVSPASGNKTATLKLTATESRDGYMYRCVVTDGDGDAVTSDAATLTIA